MSHFDHRWLYRCIGIVIFAIILGSIDFSKIKAILEETQRLWIILLALPLTYMVLFIRYYRWYRLSSRQDLCYPFWEGLIIYIASFGFSIITPGRLGELIKVNYLKNIGHRMGVSFFTVISDRVYDIGVMLLFAVPGAIFMVPTAKEVVLKRTFLCIVIMVALMLLFLAWIALMKKRKTILAERKNFILKIIDELVSFPIFVRKLGWVGILEAGTLTLVSWFLFFIQHYLFSISFSLGFSFLQIASIVSFTGLVSLLPISVSGLGTRDITLVYIFSQAGLSSEKALLFSGCMLLTIVFYGLGSFLAWELPGIKSKLISLKELPN
jgi:uncharacterized protein (TIRG00374 family)